MFRITDAVVVGIYELAKAHTSSCAHQRYIPFTQSPVVVGQRASEIVFDGYILKV